MRALTLSGKSWSLLVILFIASMTPPFRCWAQQQQKPWSKDQIIRMLKGDVPLKRVIELVRERKIDFEVMPEVEKQFRDAGADDSLMTALREVAPKSPSPSAESPARASLEINSKPNGAQVFVDDALIARTSKEGRLIVPSLQGKHRVRIALEGYHDYEADVDIAPGQIQKLDAMLESSGSTPSRDTATHPLVARAGFIIDYARSQREKPTERKRYDDTSGYLAKKLAEELQGSGIFHVKELKGGCCLVSINVVDSTLHTAFYGHDRGRRDRAG